MKENKRYLSIKGKNLKEAVEKAILDFVGALGYAKASPKWIELKGEKGILSINRKSLNEVRASFSVSGHDVKVLRVSGTLKGLRKK